MSKPTNQNSSPTNPVDSLEQVLALLASASDSNGDERRQRDRFPIYCCMRVTPANEDGHPISDDIGIVVGRDLSASGISFSHEGQLTCDFVVLELTIEDRAHFRLLAKVLWSRPSPIGLFESGCRLVRKLAWQMESPDAQQPSLVL